MAASDITPRGIETGLTGHYEPSKPGATTLLGARPLYVNAQHVTADVLGREVAVFIGTRLVYQGPLPTHVVNGADVNPWVTTFAIEFDADIPVSDRYQAYRCTESHPGYWHVLDTATDRELKGERSEADAEGFAAEMNRRHASHLRMIGRYYSQEG